MAEKLCKKVMEVKRPSERITVVRVAIGKLVMNVISVYAPQVGRTLVEKEFLDLLREVISGIDDREGMILCGDLNCHVGAMRMVLRMCMVEMVLVCVMWKGRWCLSLHMFEFDCC